MKSFMKDVEKGAVIGFKASLTGYVLAAVLLVACTGFGFPVCAMIPDVLDTIWGDR